MLTSTVCVALVIFFEAGIEPPEGMIATGWSVVNASAMLHAKPVSVCREVRYSGRYVALRGKFSAGYAIAIPVGARWRKIKHIAYGIIHGKIADPTGGANHWECTTKPVCKVPPWWAVGMEYRGRFGTQDFFKEIMT